MKKVSGITTYDVMLGELESGRWIVEISNGKETMLFPNDTFASQEEATEFVEKWIHDNHRI